MSTNKICHPSLIPSPENFFSATLVGKNLDLDIDHIGLQDTHLAPSLGPVRIEVRVVGMGTSKTAALPTLSDIAGYKLDLSDLDGHQDRRLEIRAMIHDASGRITDQWWVAVANDKSGGLADDIHGAVSDNLDPWEIELSWEEELTVVMGASIAEAVESGDVAARNQILDRILLDIWDDAALGSAMMRIHKHLARANLWPATECGLSQWLNKAQKELSK